MSLSDYITCRTRPSQAKISFEELYFIKVLIRGDAGANTDKQTK